MLALPFYFARFVGAAGTIQDVAGDFAHNISAKPLPSEITEKFSHNVSRVIPEPEMTLDRDIIRPSPAPAPA
jgi:hypothetical protein